MTEALVAGLAAAGPALTARVLDEMYRNPFWDERFGARGRVFAEQDGQFHLSYLSQALIANDAAVLTTYARWLQQLLTTRGMCTRHIVENFERLGRAIGDSVADSATAVAFLGAAVDALRYDAGLAREIQDAADALVDAAVHRRALAGWHEHLRYHVSYLADALAQQRPETFTSYHVWMEGFLERHHGHGARLRDAVAALDEAIAGAPGLSDTTRGEARRLLERAP
jgi:hypothetical protein